jgi:hypothetical protein
VKTKINRGRDRSVEKQLAASMNREQAEREEWRRLGREERVVEMRGYLKGSWNTGIRLSFRERVK